MYITRLKSKSLFHLLFFLFLFFLISCTAFIPPIREKKHPKYLSGIKTICFSVEAKRHPICFVKSVWDPQVMEKIMREIEETAYVDVEEILNRQGFNTIKLDSSTKDKPKNCDAILNVNIFGRPGWREELKVALDRMYIGGKRLYPTFHYNGHIELHPLIIIFSKGRKIFEDGHFPDERLYDAYGEGYRKVTGFQLPSGNPNDREVYLELYKWLKKNIEEDLLYRINIIRQYSPR